MSEARAHVLFISYARADDDQRRRLEILLQPLGRRNVIDVWADTRIAPGRKWTQEIEDHLDEARLAVLLVSADFLASDYIMRVELPWLLRRRVPIICVPVGPCGWQDVEDLATVQWALPPEPSLREMPSAARDKALMKVYDAVATAVMTPQILSEGSRPPARGTEEPLRPGTPGPMVGVPQLPLGHQPRPNEIELIKQRLKLVGKVGLVGGRVSLGLHGAGGVGKSVLATAVCTDEDVRRWFPDGIYWLALGESPDIVSLQKHLLGVALAHKSTPVVPISDGQLTSTSEPVASANPLENQRILADLFRPLRTLVVVDDVWSTWAADALSVTGPNGRTLYTSRDETVLSDAGAAIEPIANLDLAASIGFLRAATAPAQINMNLINRAAEHTAGNILALSLVAAVIRTGIRWDDVAHRLDRLGGVFRGHPYADVFKSMRLAVDVLKADDARLYLLLGVFPEDVAVPHATLGRLWRIDDPDELIGRLDTARLLDSDGTAVRFHDLQRSFLIFASNAPWALMHRHLLDGHRPTDGWSSLPRDDRYMWRYLAYHLRMAGELQELQSIVTSGEWLSRRLELKDVEGALRDVGVACRLWPTDAVLSEIRSTLIGWPRTRHLTLRDIAANIAFRLPSIREGLSLIDGPYLVEGKGSARIVGGSSEDDRITTVACASQSGSVAVGTSAGSIYLDDGMSAELRLVRRAHWGSVQALSLCPSGTLLASGGRDGMLFVWDVPGRSVDLAYELRMPISVRSLAFCDTRQLLGVAGGDGRVRVFETSTWKRLWDFAGCYKGSMTSLVFTPGGELVIAGGDDGRIRAWDTETGRLYADIPAHAGSIRGIACLGSNWHVVSLGSDRLVRVRPIAGGIMKVVAEAGADGLALSVDFRWLATWGSGAVIVHDISEGGHLPVLELGCPISAMCWAPDGCLLLGKRTEVAGLVLRAA